MIRNIIFDMVGVLMRFDTESYIEEHHLSEADESFAPWNGRGRTEALFLLRKLSGAYAAEYRHICILPYMICSTGKEGKSYRSMECGSCCRS